MITHINAKSFSKIRAVLLFTTALALSGCANFASENTAGGKFVVQYSTLKLIEQSDDVTSEKVMETVNRIRDRIVEGEDVSYGNLRARLMEEIGFDSLEPSDQLVVMTIVDQLVLDIDTGMKTEFISEEDLISLDMLLGWVQQAAALAK